MKKFLLIPLLISMSIILGGCLKISTPEDMLIAPELNKEKKDMKEAVEKFRPANTNLYPVYFSENKKSVNMIVSDLDEDSVSEIISFYKNKSDDKIGMFILKKENSLWVKYADTMFDTYEISNVNVSDLNGNNKKEVIVETYENNSGFNTKSYSIAYINQSNNIDFIKEIPYIVLKIFDIDSDGIKEIFSVTKSNKDSGYIMNVDRFDGHVIVSKEKKELKKVENPYDITVGLLYEDKMAVFIDYMKNNTFEDTDIIIYNKNANMYVPLSEYEEYQNKGYVFNIRCRDIDNDGVIELAYKYKAPSYKVPVQDFKAGLVYGYFKMDKNYNLTLVREIYDDDNGYSINIPSSFKGKYTISEPKDSLDININFIDSSGKEYPLIEIKYIRKYDWQQNSQIREEMQMITENQYYVVAGRVSDYSQNLKGVEKEDYLRMRSDALILSNITKERNF